MMLVGDSDSERAFRDLGKLMMKSSSLYTELGVCILQQIIDWAMVDSGRSLRRPDLICIDTITKIQLNLEIY